MNTAEALSKLAPICNLKTRVIDRKPNTRVIVAPENWSLRPGSGALVPITNKGANELVNFAGVPKGLAELLSPDLLGRMLTELIYNKERYTILMDGGNIIGFVQGSAGEWSLDPEKLLTNIDRAIPKADIQSLTVKDYAASLEIVGHETAPVQRGDLIRAGALVKFSPSGSIFPEVQSFCVRLACTNGAKHTDVLRSYRGGGGEGDNVWHWFRESMKAAYGSVKGIANRYREMIDDKIPASERALMLEELLRQAKITGKEADAVRAQAIQSPPRNAYEMFNLVTWASSHVLRNPAQIDRARTVAASFSSEESHDTFCPICHSHRATRSTPANPALPPATPAN